VGAGEHGPSDICDRDRAIVDNHLARQIGQVRVELASHPEKKVPSGASLAARNAYRDLIVRRNHAPHADVAIGECIAESS
jgi:hypothetical protein